MKIKIVVIATLLIGILTEGYSQKQGTQFSVKVTIGEDVKDQIQDKGRMYLFISENLNVEPRTQTWPSPVEPTHIFARNVDQLNINSGFQIAAGQNWNHTSEWDLSEVPVGEYNVQILWDQDFLESRIDAPGNLYSEKQKIVIDRSISVDLALSKRIPERRIMSHDLVKVIDMKSEVLSNWWKKPMHLKASILLPHSYDNSKAYPIRYNVAGYGGRYTRINRLLNDD